ncbi:MAG: V-type ATP synthase subunit I [Treponema sp.]|jgi:V/A-type H+-transporting ATPase subunit I|nr:V-type ATP synthase subunit I [Treponema sp.]
MLRPRKMIFFELSVFKHDIDAVLQYLGRKGAIHFPETETQGDRIKISHISELVERLRSACAYAGIDLKNIDAINEDSVNLPEEGDEASANDICSLIENIKNNKIKVEQNKKQVSDTLNEAKAFSRMNIRFSDLDQLSYLTFRIGRLDLKGQAELRRKMKDRAVIISLDNITEPEENGRILAATSRKGRFTLDSQLKNVSFEPINIPKDFKGIPSEMVAGLEGQLKNIENELTEIENQKKELCIRLEKDFQKLIPSWKMALVIEEIKSRFTTTESTYHFSGWTPAEMAAEVSKDLLELTRDRAAIKIFSPEEVSSIKEGKDKVPVYVKHGAFVNGFKGVVFSYGSPLYGTIDPTPLVAFFFTLLFGIMFGDVGHGFTLFFAGLLINLGIKKLKGFSKFGTPLISIGISSMVFGLLFGSVFTNEELLIGPTRAITAAITGSPMDRIVFIMPLTETGGSITKLLYFFGFTIAIGAIIISIGLIINIVNHCILKKYEEAFFSKTGLAGLALFWYALFIVVHILLGVRFGLYDIAGLFIPIICIFFGPVLWRIISGKKPVLKDGLMTFIMKGFVEVLETVSTYVSNTVSFLRVGAFALSHTVLSFIVFTFSEMLVKSGAIGTVGAVILLIFGNLLIVVLEGMIVAIQVMRLQYYEFFNKFFVETGVEFSPFRFNKNKT